MIAIEFSGSHRSGTALGHGERVRVGFPIPIDWSAETSTRTQGQSHLQSSEVASEPLRLALFVPLPASDFSSHGRHGGSRISLLPCLTFTRWAPVPPAKVADDLDPAEGREPDLGFRLELKDGLGKSPVIASGTTDVARESRQEILATRVGHRGAKWLRESLPLPAILACRWPIATRERKMTRTKVAGRPSPI